MHESSSYTPAWLFKVKGAPSPSCTECNEDVNMHHYIWSCKRFCSEREKLIDTVKKRGFSHGCCEDIVFPAGVRMIRKEVATILLRFLRETCLSDVRWDHILHGKSRSGGAIAGQVCQANPSCGNVVTTTTTTSLRTFFAVCIRWAVRRKKKVFCTLKWEGRNTDKKSHVKQQRSFMQGIYQTPRVLCI